MPVQSDEPDCTLGSFLTFRLRALSTPGIVAVEEGDFDLPGRSSSFSPEQGVGQHGGLGLGVTRSFYPVCRFLPGKFP